MRGFIDPEGKELFVQNLHSDQGIFSTAGDGSTDLLPTRISMVSLQLNMPFQTKTAASLSPLQHKYRSC